MAQINEHAERAERERGELIGKNVRLADELLQKLKEETGKAKEANQMNAALLGTIEAASLREIELSKNYEAALLKLKCFERILAEGRK